MRRVLFTIPCLIVLFLSCEAEEPSAEAELLRWYQDRYSLSEWDDEVFIRYKVSNTGEVEIERYTITFVLKVYVGKFIGQSEFCYETVKGGPIEVGESVEEMAVAHITPPRSVGVVKIADFSFE